ncbi:MAG: 50S ribosomal protein L11 methyltransferase [Chloroflexi bacterium]|nr:50S ribosomal protein L11 methyltransferase [Chloroflexota bacterium]
MNVVELAIRADAEAAEALAAAFNEYAYGGAVIEQVVTPEQGEALDAARPFTVRAFLLQDETLADKRRAIERAAWAFSMLRPVGELEVRELAAQDYANAWKKFYTILHVGARTVIKPSWLEYTPQRDEIVIELDPGMAFGTGLHPTTRLCLAALEKYVSPGVEILDVGTGSGILAIDAAKLGARWVDARDIDPIAAETAQKNVAASGLGDVIQVTRSSVTLEPQPHLYGMVAANIFADTIAELAPAIVQHLKRDGVFIASGILVERAQLVENAMRAQNMTLVEKQQEDDWLVMVYKSDGRGVG